MAVARLAGLTYWYPGSAEPALRDAGCTTGDGLTVVTGPSGGGKSTLLRVLNGLVPHFHGGRIAGSATVFGESVIDTPTRRLARSVGFVFQDPELQTVYESVGREVAFGLENMAVPRRQIWERVDEALDAVGASHLADRSVRTLSGGERQRVALASALAMRPRAVVLDEPTSQLDPDGADLVLRSVIGVVESGRAVVIAEHRLDRLMPLADGHLAVDGGLVESRDPRAWASPAPAARRPRSNALGPQAWSLAGVSAGFGGPPLLEGVELAGRCGEVVALVGPNGGGKTTLLRLIAGSLAPIAGEVERRPGRIAYLPQNPAAILHRPTLRSEVQLTIDRAGEQERPETILREMGLLHAADSYPRDLSSGERQRAAIAAVLPGLPRLVLLDEPTRGMDDESRAALAGVVARLRDSGAAVVLATHDTGLRAAVADRVVRVADGTASELPEEAVAR